MDIYGYTNCTQLPPRYLSVFGVTEVPCFWPQRFSPRRRAATNNERFFAVKKMAGLATGTGKLSIQFPVLLAKFWSVVPRISRIQLTKVVSQELIVGEEDLVRAVFVKSFSRLGCQECQGMPRPGLEITLSTGAGKSQHQNARWGSPLLFVGV